jgi:hypothetical protein
MSSAIASIAGLKELGTKQMTADSLLSLSVLGASVKINLELM